MKKIILRSGFGLVLIAISFFYTKANRRPYSPSSLYVSNSFGICKLFELNNLDAGFSTFPGGSQAAVRDDTNTVLPLWGDVNCTQKVYFTP